MTGSLKYSVQLIEALDHPPHKYSNIPVGPAGDSGMDQGLPHAQAWSPSKLKKTRSRLSLSCVYGIWLRCFGASVHNVLLAANDNL